MPHTPKHMPGCHKSGATAQVVQKIDRGSACTMEATQRTHDPHLSIEGREEMLTPATSWRTLSFLMPGAAELRAESQEDNRPHGQDRSQQAKQERRRVGKISVPDRGNPAFQSHLSALGASGEV